MGKGGVSFCSGGSGLLRLYISKKKERNFSRIGEQVLTRYIRKGECSGCWKNIQNLNSYFNRKIMLIGNVFIRGLDVTALSPTFMEKRFLKYLAGFIFLMIMSKLGLVIMVT